MSTGTDSAAVALRRLMMHHADEVRLGHMWVSEHDRWLELVFAVLCAACANEQIILRALTAELDALGLLAVSSAASDEAWIEICLSTMRRRNVQDQDAERALAAVRQAAKALQTHHDGKIQKLLRKHGERLIADITAEFDLHPLDVSEARTALVYWLQNVMSLPVPLPGGALEDFAAANGTLPASIIAAADRLDLNLAFVDDMVLQDRKMRLPAIPERVPGK